MGRMYIAIDLKSFYASVECVDRGLDPLKANLVVADPTRTEKTICLAVTPALKAYGIPGRARLFEVYQKLREIKARTGKAPDIIIAPPRMRKYIQVSADIYSIYLKYISPEDNLIWFHNGHFIKKRINSILISMCITKEHYFHFISFAISMIDSFKV